MPRKSITFKHSHDPIFTHTAQTQSYLNAHARGSLFSHAIPRTLITSKHSDAFAHILIQLTLANTHIHLHAHANIFTHATLTVNDI